MEANPPPLWLVAGLAAAAAVLAVAAVGSASHEDGDTDPYCQPMSKTASSPLYEVARVRSTGYVEEPLDALGVDKTARETVEPFYFGDPPHLFEDREGQGLDQGIVERDIHVVGEHLTVKYPGVPNHEDNLGNHLPDGTPKTVLETRYHPLGTEAKSFKGAHKVEMVFSGRIIVWDSVEYSCIPDDNDNQAETYSAQRVLLEGFGTATGLDAAVEQDRFGTGLAVQINAGPNHDRSLD